MSRPSSIRARYLIAGAAYAALLAGAYLLHPAPAFADPPAYNAGAAVTGITAVFSTTGCFTKTASATAFIRGKAQ
jgi:hypothetical protein